MHMVVHRIAYVGAREGHFPVAVSFINYQHFTPAPAVLAEVRPSFR